MGGGLTPLGFLQRPRNLTLGRRDWFVPSAVVLAEAEAEAGSEEQKKGGTRPGSAWFRD